MATLNESVKLLDACIAAAMSLGHARAANVDTTEHFRELRDAIRAYLDSFWYLPVDERPDEKFITGLMVKNAYLAYLHAAGELTVEQLPETFKMLEVPDIDSF